MKDFIEDNRKHWEELAELHPETDYYDIEGFLEGESTLDPIEPEELGATGLCPYCLLLSLLY